MKTRRRICPARRALLLAAIPLLLTCIAGTVGAQPPGPDVYEYTVNPGGTLEFMQSTLPKPWLYTYRMSAITNGSVYLWVISNSSASAIHNVTVGTTNQSLTWSFQGPITIFWRVTNVGANATRFTLVSDLEYNDGSIPGYDVAIIVSMLAVSVMLAVPVAKRRVDGLHGA